VRRLDSLRWRLVGSYLLVIGVGAATLVAVARVAGPRFFRIRMEGMGRHMNLRIAAADLDVAFTASLTRALVVSVAVSMVAALLIGGIFARRIVSPVERIRRATHRLADGHYDERIEPPAETELAALAEDVNILAAALAETEQARMRLISEVAHELRTPLTSIEGYMEGLIDGIFPPTEETFASVAEEAARLKRLAGDLSTLSRLAEGADAPDLRPVDLARLVGAVAERLRPQFLDGDVRLTVSVPPVTVPGDGDRLTQVIVNLLGNALSHTPPGGEVRVVGERNATTARLAVIDSGEGIPAEEVGRVFDRFYRGAGAQGGSGIGLTIARAVARAHGGDLTAASAGKGHGATFTLELPTGG